MRPGEPPTSERLRGVALSVTICTAFGAIWGVSGSAALPGVWRWLAASVVLAVTVVLLRTAAAFRRSARRSTTASTGPFVSPFRTMAYRIAVGAEITAIPVAGRVLTANGYDGAVMPAVAAIVGLHFFGLVPAFRSPHFAWVGAAFCGLALTALTLPVRVAAGGGEVGVRAAFVGLGCALILWLGVVPMIARTRRHLAAR